VKAKTKISKKLRADAIRILSAVARTANGMLIYEAECHFGGDAVAGDLARAAYYASNPLYYNSGLYYAEAECMLLEGWEP